MDVWGKGRLPQTCAKCNLTEEIMNIALRPSGGRGEYELAGTQGELHISDLFGLPIFIEILPAVAVNAYSKCLLKDGKPRIRLENPNVRNSHPASLIAGAMMLPKPRRERHETHGANLLRWEQFVVQTMRIDVVRFPLSPGRWPIRASETSWQGNPPDQTSDWGMSIARSSLMFSWQGISGQCSLRMLRQNSFISH